MQWQGERRSEYGAGAQPNSGGSVERQRQTSILGRSLQLSTPSRSHLCSWRRSWSQARRLGRLNAGAALLAGLQLAQRTCKSAADDRKALAARLPPPAAPEQVRRGLCAAFAPIGRTDGRAAAC